MSSLFDNEFYYEDENDGKIGISLYEGIIQNNIEIVNDSDEKERTIDHDLEQEVYRNDIAMEMIDRLYKQIPKHLQFYGWKITIRNTKDCVDVYYGLHEGVWAVITVFNISKHDIHTLRTGHFIRNASGSYDNVLECSFNIQPYDDFDKYIETVFSNNPTKKLK